MATLRDCFATQPYTVGRDGDYPERRQVQLTRTSTITDSDFFQFGIFYNDNMEFHPGPRFDFGGRVHSNGTHLMMSGIDLFFRSRVTAVGEIVRDVSRNGIRKDRPPSGWSWDGNVWVADTAGYSGPSAKAAWVAT